MDSILCYPESKRVSSIAYVFVPSVHLQQNQCTIVACVHRCIVLNDAYRMYIFQAVKREHAVKYEVPTRMDAGEETRIGR